MLEIKNLTKIYKSKGGVEVKALDNVSLKFPETGMVFLLGKSGSGKSTLLNVCGGLDNPTSGEIVVKGRSSIDFKQSDFDSYRNTFVGFIFQEYNILDEFTVEENIALALELQGREKDKSAINNLLKMVDLKGYNDRKPNTLSGGQKQRLAIARALIKSPEIIMADEPTGALDSATGKQVFDTLKELSKDTLIMVVSHDRDFAEKYGDRIIELKDGSIISDVTKTSDGFKETKDSDIKIKEYDKKDSEFIDSKFPLKHAIRMGLSSLKNKKFRLVMTIFLCTVAFTMFGLLSTVLFYDEENVFKKTLQNVNLSFLQLDKEYEVTHTSYADGEINYQDKINGWGHITKDEVNNFIKEYGSDTFGTIDVTYKINVHNTNSEYWLNTILKLGYLKEDNSIRKNMIGKYPSKNNEIALTTYMVDVIKYSKMDDIDTGTTLSINEGKDLIGKKIKLQDKVYTITGIIDSGSISSKFDKYKNIPKIDEKVFSEFIKELEDGIHLVAFVTESELEIRGRDYSYFEDEFFDRNIYVTQKKNNSYDFTNGRNGYYSSFNTSNNKYEIMKLKEFDSLSEKQAIIDYRTFGNLVMEYYNNDISGKEDIVKMFDLASIVQNSTTFIYEDGKEPVMIELNESETYEKTLELFKLVKEKNIKLDIGFKLFNIYDNEEYGETKEVEVVGIFYGENINSSEYKLILNDNLYKELTKKEIENGYPVFKETKYVDNGFYDSVYVSFDKSDEQIDKFYDIYSNLKYNENSSRTSLTGTTISMLDTVNYMIEEFSKIFFWVGLVFAIFASLLFSNFISVSISYKKREIGILRAIGAKGKDVFKIFFSESFVVAMICIILSCTLSIVLSTLLNNALDLGVTVLVFGVLSFIFVIGIALITSVLATFLPVNKAARKKPIDSIRSV